MQVAATLSGEESNGEEQEMEKQQRKSVGSCATIRPPQSSAGSVGLWAEVHQTGN